MQPVRREEIVDYVTYEDERPAFRERVLAAKDLRRVHVGRFLTFLFENRDTVRYQVQEMMRAERIVREAEILHELRTYNELIGEPGGVKATLLIEIVEEAERARRLPRWLDLNERLYLRLEDGTRVRPTWDQRQIGRGRLSSVQYLAWALDARVPVALGCDHPDPDLAGEVELSPAQRAALGDDLAA